VEELYEETFEIVQMYGHLIDPAKWTKEVFTRAYSLVATRGFGWSLPYMMLVPFADNCNHFCVENYFELFNARLTRKALRKDALFNNHEK
jgi:hypothetical protein